MTATEMSRPARLLRILTPRIFLAALVFGLLLIGQSGARPVSADHLRQAPKEVTYTGTFHTTQPDMFGPNGARPSSGRELDLFEVDWDKGAGGDLVKALAATFEFLGIDIDIPGGISA